MAEDQVLETNKPLFSLKKYPCVVVLFEEGQCLILCCVARVWHEFVLDSLNQWCWQTTEVVAIWVLWREMQRAASFKYRIQNLVRTLLRIRVDCSRVKRISSWGWHMYIGVRVYIYNALVVEKTLRAVKIEWILSTMWSSWGRNFLPNVNGITLGKNNTEHVNCNKLAIDDYTMFHFK